MRELPSLVLLPVCVMALWGMTASGQDDGGPPPPQADIGAAPLQGDGGSSPQAYNGAPAPDDADGAPVPDSGVSFQTFYDALGNQGTWVQSSDYGYVWQPQESDPNWAPYTEGHWVYSDAGWTWVSNEPFGWATFHYGRWVNLDGTGWCWVPGYTWAPAWVSWRYGDGYAGWAPLPPDSLVGVDYSDDGYAIGVGFHIGGDCDGFYGIGPGWYNFVPVTCLGYRSYHGYYCHRGDNYAIINRTTNVTNINVAQGGGRGEARFGHVTTGGPMLEQVNAASSAPVQRVSLVRARQPGGGGTVTGNSLAVYSPHISTSGTAQPARVAGAMGTASINRGTDVTRPLAVNSRLGGEAATEAQVQQARIARDQAPVSAKVMTDEASVRPILQAPLTTMRPVAAPARTFAAPSDEFSSGTRGPVITPPARTYPQASTEGNVPSRVYYPNTASPSAGSTYYPPRPPAEVTRPSAERPAYVQPGAPVVHQSVPIAHESQGGPPGGGGYSTSGGSANRGTPNGGGNSAGAGSYHSGGGNSSQGH
jgi:hypothetical protein